MEKVLSKMMKDAIEFVENEHKSLIYGYSVKDPSRYGVVEFDQDKNIISIEEKPNKSKIKPCHYWFIFLYK